MTAGKVLIPYRKFACPEFVAPLPDQNKVGGIVNFLVKSIPIGKGQCKGLQGTYFRYKRVSLALGNVGNHCDSCAADMNWIGVHNCWFEAGDVSIQMCFIVTHIASIGFDFVKLFVRVLMQ